MESLMNKIVYSLILGSSILSIGFSVFVTDTSGYPAVSMKKLTPDLMVEDVNTTVKYYCDILGFDFVMAVQRNSEEIFTELSYDKPMIYALVNNGVVELMVESIADNPYFKDMEISGSFSLFIEVENIGLMYERLKDKVHIVRELHATFYGTEEFYIRDCNGYFLAFSERREK